jgi:hypothetical protein
MQIVAIVADLSLRKRRAWEVHVFPSRRKSDACVQGVHFLGMCPRTTILGHDYQFCDGWKIHASPKQAVVEDLCHLRLQSFAARSSESVSRLSPRTGLSLSTVMPSSSSDASEELLPPSLIELSSRGRSGEVSLSHLGFIMRFSSRMTAFLE